MEALDMNTELQNGQAINRRLAELLSINDASGKAQSSIWENIIVSGLATDSRKVIKGDLFFALNGLTVDGRNYIAGAIKRGAVAVLAESSEAAENFTVRKQSGVVVIDVPGLSKKLSAIAGRYYGDPSKDLTVIGVTGTNGKTSCSHLIASLADSLGQQSGLLGTLGFGVFHNVGQHGDLELQTTGFTTPDAVQLQACIKGLADKHCTLVAAEVSSHALAQHRADAIGFDVAVLTNLSHDHLDFHKDMASYADAKRRLFYINNVSAAVINADDSFGAQLAAELKSESPADFGRDLTVLTYSTQAVDTDLPESQQPDIYVRNTRYALNKIVAEVITPWGSGFINIPLIGEFNLSNALAALTAMLATGADFKALLAVFAQVPAVKGRMEIVFDSNGDSLSNKTVVVDYAHTPQALELALKALRPHTEQRLWCVFGCGGDRDQDKRSAMGRVARALADNIVITSDNPRSEPPEQIIDDILLGIDDMHNVNVEQDRAGAIAFAVAQAQAGDLLLIAGKGHEQFQIIGDMQLPFSDVDVVRKNLLAESQQ